VILLLFVLPLSSGAAVKDFGDETFSLGFGLSTYSLSSTLSNDTDADSSTESLIYSPNNQGNLGFTFQYGNVGASLSWAGKLSSENQEVDVKTRFQDYQFRFLGPQISYKVFFQRYKGYYISNPEDFPGGGMQNDPENLLPGLEKLHYGVGAIYNFSPERYSLDAGFGIHSFQTESGGAFLVALDLDHHEFNSDESMIPSYASSNFASIDGWKGSVFTSLTVSGGGGYNYCSGNLIIGGLLLVGAAIQKQKHRFDDLDSTKVVVTNRNMAGINIGYDDQVHKLFLALMLETSTSPIEEGEVDTQMTTANLTYVYRFQDVDIPVLKKVSRWLDSRGGAKGE